MAKRLLLYIMSPSYSGSTLITRVMAEHPEISTVGELKATGIDDIETYLCSCNERFLDCGFWNNLKDQLRVDNIDLNLRDLETTLKSGSSVINSFMRPNLRGPILESIRAAAFALVPKARRELRDMLLRQEKIIDKVCEFQGGRVFLDESKDPLRALYFAESNLWDFRVIHLVRDGRGTVNSDIKHKNRPLAVACNEWNAKIDEMNRLVEMTSAPVLRVSYEQLCTEPERTIAELLRFADIHDPLDINAPGTTQHILGNDMRLKPMREIRLDEKWKNDLDESQLSEFYKLSGQKNRELGYN